MRLLPRILPILFIVLLCLPGLSQSPANPPAPNSFHSSHTMRAENYTSDQNGAYPEGIVRNFTFSGQGYSLGSPWTEQKGYFDTFNFLTRGIGQSRVTVCKSYAVGDKSCGGAGYSYIYADAGATAGSDEGIEPQVIELYQNDDWYHGLVANGATTGTTLLPTTYSSSITKFNRNQGSDGGYAIDTTRNTISGTITGAAKTITGISNPSNAGAWSLPVSNTVTPSSACGSIQTAIPRPTNPLTPQSITVEVNISTCRGAFKKGVASLSGGWYIEQVPITAVGIPSGDIQSVTITHRYLNPAGTSSLWQGGTQGYISFDRDMAINGFRTVFPIAGALDSHHLAIGVDIRGTNIPGGLSPYRAPIALGAVTGTGTTVSAIPRSALQTSIFDHLPTATISGCANPAFDGTATNIRMSDDAANYSLPIISWTQKTPGGNTAGCSISLPTSDFGYHVYPGAEQIAPMTSTNQLPLEPNTVQWTAGDGIEVAQNPAWHSANNFQVENIVNLYGDGVGYKHWLFGEGISGGYQVDSTKILTPCSVYSGCGGLLSPIPFETKSGVNGGIISADTAPLRGAPMFSIGCPPAETGGCSNHSRQAVFSFQRGAGALWWHPDTNQLESNGGFLGNVGTFQKLTVAGQNVCQANGTNCPTSETLPVGSLTTTAAASDPLAINGMTSHGHCSLAATNASAAAHIATTYISAKSTNRIVLSHSATAGMTYDIVCTSY